MIATTVHIEDTKRCHKIRFIQSPQQSKPSQLLMPRSRLVIHFAPIAKNDLHDGSTPDVWVGHIRLNAVNEMTVCATPAKVAREGQCVLRKILDSFLPTHDLNEPYPRQNRVIA
jgi:hypothetical protein